MTAVELLDLVRDLFLDGDKTIPLDAETKLIESGICDSLALLQIAMEIERKLPGRRIDDQDITRDNFGSVALIQQYLSR